MHYKYYLPYYEAFFIIYSQQACNFQASFHVSNAAETMKIRKYSASAS